MSQKLGPSLRAAREAKGCSLEEVERVTRIRAKFLAALEQDKFSALPSDAQARGFLHNYAEFLDLEPAQLLALYDEARHKKPRLGPLARPAWRAPTPPESQRPAQGATPLPPRSAPMDHLGRAPQVRSRRPRWLSPDLLFAVAVTIVIVLLMTWAFQQLTANADVPPTPTLISVIAGSTALSNDATATSPAANATATAEALPTPLAQYVGVNLSVRAEQRAWVSVKVDGAEQFAGLMAPGETRDFVGQNVVEVTTGNGLGTRIIWNGRDQGTLGDLGEVVTRLWTLQGMLLPTSTPAPTATP